MRYLHGQKQKTRQRIVDAAAVVCRRLGYHAAGVDAVMQEAGLTAGAFYSHFSSKEDLFKEALPHAMNQTRMLVGHDLSEVAGRYLSIEHCRRVDTGCPLPALLPEVARCDSAKASFVAVLRRVAAHLPADESQALAVLSLLIGGITLARAVPDETLAEKILMACRSFVAHAVIAVSTTTV
jgi:TetR/AcrR family transcriptional regulator, transcriptional repressor for nem operon